eukprot:5199819-Amphidinium_carterae.1
MLIYTGEQLVNSIPESLVAPTTSLLRSMVTKALCLQASIIWEMEVVGPLKPAQKELQTRFIER